MGKAKKTSKASKPSKAFTTFLKKWKESRHSFKVQQPYDDKDLEMFYLKGKEHAILETLL